MKVTREKTENSQAYLTVELDADEVEAGMKVAYRHLVAKANIPGFRKGKAPRPIVERYLGKEALLEDALNHIIPETLDKAIQEQGIEAVARPDVELVKTETPVTYKAVIPLKPVLEIGDYKSIRIPKEKVETTEASVNAVFEDLRHHHATWEPVERAVQFGDQAALSIQSTLVDGKPFFNQDSVQYIVREGSGSPLKGFAEQIAGMKKDEEKEFKLTFPQDDSRTELAGKEANFKVKVLEVKEEKLPELNDDLAKQINPEYETLDKLRTYVSENMTKRAEEQARIDYEDKVVDAVIAVSKVEFPPVLVEGEVEHLLEQQQHRLEAAGLGGLEEYMRATKKTEQQVRDDLKPAASKNVTRHLILDKIAEENNIKPTDPEIEQEIATMIEGTSEQNLPRMKEMMATPQARHSVEHFLETKKTIEMLVNLAQGQENKSEDQPKSEIQAKSEGQEKAAEAKEGENK